MQEILIHLMHFVVALVAPLWTWFSFVAEMLLTAVLTDATSLLCG
jgi:hypothetical protein